MPQGRWHASVLHALLRKIEVQLFIAAATIACQVLVTGFDLQKRLGSRAKLTAQGSCGRNVLGYEVVVFDSVLTIGSHAKAALVDARCPML